MDSVLDWLGPLLEGYAGAYPWLVSVLLVIGSARLFVKPVMSLVLAYVQVTPKKSDDKWFNDNVLNAKWYKTASYILDWVGSIKLPQKK